MKKTADQWFAEFGDSRPQPSHTPLRWIFLSVIFLCLLGFVWSIPVPPSWLDHAPWFNWTLVAIALTSLFYAWLSPALSAGMLFFMSLCYTALVLLDVFAPWPVWQICAVLFVLAVIGQFASRSPEGRQPLLHKRILLPLVGPARLMSAIYRKVGQRY